MEGEGESEIILGFCNYDIVHRGRGYCMKSKAERITVRVYLCYERTAGEIFFIYFIMTNCLQNPFYSLKTKQKINRYMNKYKSKQLLRLNI